MPGRRTPGSRFSANVQAATTGGSTPEIAGGTNGEVCIAFPDNTSSTNRTKAAFTTDDGQTWTTDQRINDTTGDSDFGHVGYNALYRNFIVAWIANDTGPYRQKGAAGRTGTRAALHSCAALA